MLIYETIYESLLERFPEFREQYDHEMDVVDCYKPGPHVLYGNVLNHYVTELLRANKDSKMILRIFDFYEEMAQSEDEEVNNLLQVTLLEYLWDEKEIYRKALDYMLPATRRVNACIKEYLNEPVE